MERKIRVDLYNRIRKAQLDNDKKELEKLTKEFNYQIHKEKMEEKAKHPTEEDARLVFDSLYNIGYAVINVEKLKSIFPLVNKDIADKLHDMIVENDGWRER